MIDQKEGETDFTIKMHYDDMVRNYCKGIFIQGDLF